MSIVFSASLAVRSLTLSPGQYELHLSQQLGYFFLRLEPCVSRRAFHEKSRSLTFCSFGDCCNLLRRSLVGLTRSDLDLLRQKKAIGEDSSILAAVFTVNKMILCSTSQGLDGILVAYQEQEKYFLSQECWWRYCITCA